MLGFGERAGGKIVVMHHRRRGLRVEASADVGVDVVSGVAGADHRAEAREAGVAVVLLEFDEHVGVGLFRRFPLLVHAGGHGFDGVLVVVIVVVALAFAIGQAVVEVHFQAIDAVLAEQALGFFHDILAHLGASGAKLRQAVDTEKLFAVALNEILFQARIDRAVGRDAQRCMPEYHLEAQRLDVFHQLGQVGQFPGVGLVHAEVERFIGIVIETGAEPAVVEDDRADAQIACDLGVVEASRCGVMSAEGNEVHVHQVGCQASACAG